MFPLCIPGCKLPVLLRTSIVDQEVPLLISRSALQAMGMIMNLVDGSMKFDKLGCEAAKVTTSTGHVGFSIMAAETCHWGNKLDWSTVDREKEAEIFFVCVCVCESEGTTRLRTRALSDSHPSCDVFPEPHNHMRDISDVLEQCHLNQRECDRAAGLVNSRHGPSDSAQGSTEEEAGEHRSHPRIPEGHSGGGGLAVNVPGQAQGDLYRTLKPKKEAGPLVETLRNFYIKKVLVYYLRERDQTLAGMDQEPIHFGDRDVRGRHHGGACPDWDLGGHDQGRGQRPGCSSPNGANMPRLRRGDVAAHEPCDSQQILGMSPVPQLQKDFSTVDRWKPNMAAMEKQQRDKDGATVPPEMARKGGYVKSPEASVGDSQGSWERSHGNLDRGQGRSEVQCQPDSSGVEGIERAPEDQMGREAPGVSEPGEWKPRPLSRRPESPKHVSRRRL